MVPLPLNIRWLVRPLHDDSSDNNRNPPSSAERETAEKRIYRNSQDKVPKRFAYPNDFSKPSQTKGPEALPLLSLNWVNRRPNGPLHTVLLALCPTARSSILRNSAEYSITSIRNRKYGRLIGRPQQGAGYEQPTSPTKVPAGRCAVQRPALRGIARDS